MQWIWQNNAVINFLEVFGFKDFVRDHIHIAIEFFEIGSDYLIFLEKNCVLIWY